MAGLKGPPIYGGRANVRHAQPTARVIKEPVDEPIPTRDSREVLAARAKHMSPEEVFRELQKSGGGGVSVMEN